MKKLLLSMMLGSLVLVGCNSKTEEANKEADSGSDSITVENEKEALTSADIVKKSIEKYGETVSYIQRANLDIEDEESSYAKVIMTVDEDENAKFEADINGDVITFYEVDEEAFVVENGKLSEVEPMNLSKDATYGDIIKTTENLQGGKIKQEDDQFYLTYDLSNEENRDVLFGNNLAQSIQELEDVEGTLVLVYSKSYVLTEARVEGIATEDGEKIDFMGNTKFKSVGSIDKIELPK